ncbi:MAG: NTP transferase domain-containing protein [archaeon]|nr:NTP transferase domain-containing protein [archaeon]
MEALVNAGGKGTRMGVCGIEKPMQIVGGEPVIGHVVDAMVGADRIDRLVVSVSHNTPMTEAYLKDRGVETVRTSGESFMDDLHQAFSVLTGDFVLTSPSDIPLMTSEVLNDVVDSFRPEMQSMIVLIEEEVVKSMDIIPSFSMPLDGDNWVLSGVSVMDRKATLDGVYLRESYLKTKWKELAVNVNTPGELETARNLFNHLDGI